MKKYIIIPTYCYMLQDDVDKSLELLDWLFNGLSDDTNYF